ncbi:MAG: type II/IV secretion system protein [Gemmatimonadales bacterium]|nr:type II/IV secretion system protein [Gemmatimonadota bacterium]MBP6442877.1 type II/IV secretion system protein [Gemmatimonadales bacterium]MBP6570150.1 type II/IV secretion system protein [Gemmatimonadales bacterium]MBP7619497.1 type II/IV secretion system protein [Gemmatimonadales bacterium]
MASFNDEWLATILGPLLPAGTLERAQEGQTTHDSLWERVLDARMLPEADILAALSARCRLPIADLTLVDAAGRDALPEALARRYRVVPVSVTDALLLVATANPFDVGAEQALAFATGREVRMALASPPRIREKLDELYGTHINDGTVADMLSGMDGLEGAELVEEASDDETDLLTAEATSRPIIKLVNVLLADGIISRASDIHIESGEQSVIVRYRIDGVLRQAMTIPRKAGIPLISRVKIMAGMDIADRLRPQDGRARVSQASGTPVDLRISTLPATHGEKVVIRILNTQSTALALPSLGLYPEEQDGIRRMLGHKEGVVLCTGPTGSGKTTTLYACIREIQREGINIITVEDPVEYRLGRNIVQVQTNDKQGLTFAAALRSILRQDPDVVLVGEIRDLETAQIAVQASLTGHLVLSTLHTNDAPNTVTRLVDMGLEAFKIGAALRGVIAQRLMRQLCPVCRTSQPIAELPARVLPYVPEGAQLFKAVGCGQCTQTGYRGRFSIVELLEMTPELERVVGSNATAHGIAEMARANGMLSLFDCGLRHVLDGHTSIDELLRVTDIPSHGTVTPRGGSELLAVASAVPPVAAPIAPPPVAPAPRSDAFLDDLELVDEPPAGSEEVAPVVARATILLVEDEDTLRRVMRDLLEQEGYRICEARDGAEALEQVDRHNPDLVLLDLNLPNVDGYSVLAQLRSRPATMDLPVVVLSARGDEDNEVRVLQLGATDFLTKPFRPRALAARLEATLGRRQS